MFFFILVQYFVNAKGVPRIYWNGFFYRLNTRATNKLHWSCDLRSSVKCRAALTTNPRTPNFALVSSSAHNHDRNVYKKVEKLKPITDQSKLIDNTFVTKQTPSKSF